MYGLSRKLNKQEFISSLPLFLYMIDAFPNTMECFMAAHRHLGYTQRQAGALAHPTQPLCLGPSAWCQPQLLPQYSLRKTKLQQEFWCSSWVVACTTHHSDYNACVWVPALLPATGHPGKQQVPAPGLRSLPLTWAELRAPGFCLPWLVQGI